MHSLNHIDHFRKWLYFLTRTQHLCTSAQWNTSVSGHKQETVGFAQLQLLLPRLTADSSLIPVAFLVLKLYMMFRNSRVVTGTRSVGINVGCTLYETRTLSSRYRVLSVVIVLHSWMTSSEAVRVFQVLVYYNILLFMCQECKIVIPCDSGILEHV
jgi:hypothetical protein